MIDRIRHLLGGRGTGGREMGAREADGARAHDPLELAAAALLVHAACVDASFDEIERRRILDILLRRFSLTAEEADTLLATAEDKADGAVQILGFTRTVKDLYSYEERVALVEMLWEVVLADGRVDAHEAQLMRRIGGLIYVSDRDGAMARRRAAARLEAGEGSSQLPPGRKEVG